MNAPAVEGGVSGRLWPAFPEKTEAYLHKKGAFSGTIKSARRKIIKPLEVSQNETQTDKEVS